MRRLLSIAWIGVSIFLTGCGQQALTENQTAVASDVSSADTSLSETEEMTAGDIVLITCEQEQVHISGEGAVYDEGVVTISRSGTYQLSGKSDHIQFIVDAKKTAEVTLILNGASFTCRDNAVIYGKKAASVNIELAKGTENSLSDTEEGEADQRKNAVIKMDCALNVTGEGHLTIDGLYEDAINVTDTFCMSDGSLTLSAVDDAIHSDGSLMIKDGEIEIIACEEGLEATEISVSGGNVSLTSQDDGVNVNLDGGKLEISGGQLEIHASGDGMDSNGSIEITGGSIIIDGPSSGADSAFDAENGIVMTGGEVIASGSSAMLQYPQISGEQCLLIWGFNNASEGTEWKISDIEGNILLSGQLEKAVDSLVIVSEKLKSGETITLSINNQEEQITLSEGTNQCGQMSGRMGNPNGMNREERMPSDQTKPDDWKQMPEFDRNQTAPEKPGNSNQSF